jgi:ATP-dependent 26S proteasome regulatory subunit
VFYEVDRMSDILFNEEFKKKNIDNTLNTNSQPVIINNSKSESKGAKDDKDSFNIHHILDILDGIPERTGQIIMMSTNNFEKLDKALLRPGRIDCPIHFQKCNADNTIKLIEDYFEKKILDKNKLNLKDRKFTPAEIFQICSKHNSIEKVLKALN